MFTDRIAWSDDRLVSETTGRFVCFRWELSWINWLLRDNTRDSEALDFAVSIPNLGLVPRSEHTLQHQLQKLREPMQKVRLEMLMRR